jgi:hypothetical protein
MNNPGNSLFMERLLPWSLFMDPDKAKRRKP